MNKYLLLIVLSLVFLSCKKERGLYDCSDHCKSYVITDKVTPTYHIVVGDLIINDETDFTVALPQEEPGVVVRGGVVRFVDKGPNVTEYFVSNRIRKIDLNGYLNTIF